MRSLKRMFGFGAERAPDMTDQAIASLKSIGEKADQLNATLEPYLKAHDPFAAFVGAMYNARQVERIYMGPPK